MSESLPLFLSGLFVLSVIFIWFMIAYQLLLTVAGFFHRMNSSKEKEEMDRIRPLPYPRVCVLIPAHNEEKVIERTLEAMLRFDYPKDKLQILVINDGSSDRTGEMVKEVARSHPQVIYAEVPEKEGGRGKSHVLNCGLKQTDAEVIAVYDADNQPLPEALKYLVAQLVVHP